MMRKWLSLLLCLVMLLTIAPAAAAAESGEQTETPEAKTPMTETADSERSYSSAALAVGLNTFKITSSNDTVYRPFKPSVSDYYTVFSIGSDDTYGVIQDSGKNNIVSDDDGGSGPNFSMMFYLEAGTTYYIGARYYFGGTGSIDVVIEQQNAPQFNGTVEWNKNDVQFKGSTPYVIADGTAKKPRFTVKDSSGKTVSASNYSYYYLENTDAGTGYVCIVMKGSYSGMLRGWFKIYLPATTDTHVENTDDGIRISWDAVPGAAGYVIYRRAWSTTTNGWTDFARWDNTTETTWTDGIDPNHKVYAGTRYQYGVKAYFAQRQDPVSAAIIGGNVGDNYNLGIVGPLKTTVRITSREMMKLTAGSGKITASWSGSKNFTGYQLSYATNAAFTKNEKRVTISNPQAYSREIGSLTNGTRYYFRIRSYQVFEGMTYYGAWSNVLWVNPGSGETIVPLRAVLVGENKYDSGELRGCVNDMYSMSGMLRWLKQPYYTETLPNSTKSEIISAIRTQFKNNTDSSISLFHYSGHGVNASGDATYQGALVPIDEDYLTFSELAAELSKVKGRVIVILDSCHSGASIAKGQSFDAEAFNRAAIEAFAPYTLEDETAARSGELKKSKFIVITAAKSTESSYDGRFDGSGYYQGAFTASLIKGMGCSYPKGSYTGSNGSMPADKNGNKSVTLKELYDCICSTIGEWLSDSNGNPVQNTQYYGTDSTVLFSR